MERAWKYYKQLDAKDDYICTISPDKWLDDPKGMSQYWKEFKSKIPRPLAFIALNNPVSFYMEYCFRMVNNENFQNYSRNFPELEPSADCTTSVPS